MSTVSLRCGHPPHCRTPLRGLVDSSQHSGPLREPPAPSKVYFDIHSRCTLCCVGLVFVGDTPTWRRCRFSSVSHSFFPGLNVNKAKNFNACEKRMRLGGSAWGVRAISVRSENGLLIISPLHILSPAPTLLQAARQACLDPAIDRHPGATLAF